MEQLRERYGEARVEVRAGNTLNYQRLEFSDDGKWFFVCHGRLVKVYGFNSFEVVLSLRHHTAEVTAVALNPWNRTQLLSAALDGHLAVWDYTDASLLRVIDFATPLFGFVVRPGKFPITFFFTVLNSANVEMMGRIPQDHQHTAVGLRNEIITERLSSVAPSDQLAKAQCCLSVGSRGTTVADVVFTREGSFVASFALKTLHIYNLITDKHYKYPTQWPITCLAAHPSSRCLATGHVTGAIHLWYDFGRDGGRPVKSLLHWHAHDVASVCFTSEGSYLLSGGEEAVLVLWQLGTQQKSFRPRLGSPLTRICVAPRDKFFAVSLQSNVINLISGLDTEVSATLGELRRALAQHPKQKSLRTGLVWDPLSRSLVLNSTPGLLQFYNPSTGGLTKEVDITDLNYVSRPQENHLILLLVDHVAFSSCGRWMATVECRSGSDDVIAPELRMKFWEFNDVTQTYRLNTVVDPPHTADVTSLSFKPQRGNGLENNRQLSDTPPSVAITTSSSGKFKIWLTVETEKEETEWKEEEKEEEDKKKKVKEEEEMMDGGEGDALSVRCSWACQSVGYLHDLPCLGAAFSGDGSLLAINFKKYVTLWEPHSCKMRKTFSSVVHGETFIDLLFGHRSSSHCLIASTPQHLHIWDLLHCSLLWCMSIAVSVLVSDPFGSLVAAFAPSKATPESVQLFLFHPSSPSPVAAIKDVCKGHVSGAVFLPPGGKGGGEWAEGVWCDECETTLFFMNDKQVLYSLETGKDSGGSDTAEALEFPISQTEGAAERAFWEVFGDVSSLTKTHSVSQHGKVAVLPQTSSSIMQIFQAPPHVIPPMSSLCHRLLQSLLSPALPRDTAFREYEADRVPTYNVRADCSSGALAPGSKVTLSVRLSSPLPMEEVEEEEEEEGGAVVKGCVGEYDWLSDMFA